MRRLTFESLENRRLFTFDLVDVLLPDPVGPQKGASYGFAIAETDKYRVIGSPLADVGAFYDLGIVEIYDRSNGSLLRTISSPQFERSARFGQTLALEGSILVVGAGSFNNNTEYVVYVYDLDSVNWSDPILTLRSLALEKNDRFGSSIAIQGNTLVVAAPGGTIPYNLGSVFVYDLADPNPQSTVRRLRNPQPDSKGADFFGAAIALDDNVLAISDTRSRSVFVYDLLGSSDEPLFELQGPIGHFLGALELEDGKLVVAGGGGAASFATLYDLTSSNPSEPIGQFSKPPGRTGVNANTLELFGRWLAIGEEFSHEEITVYDLSSPTPLAPFHRLSNPDRSLTNYFGTMMVGIDDQLSVGGRFYTTYQEEGAVFVYDMAASNPNSSFTTIRNDLPSSLDQFGISVDVSNEFVAVGNATDQIFLYDRQQMGSGAAIPLITIDTSTNTSGGASPLSISDRYLAVGGAGSPFRQTAQENDVVVYDLLNDPLSPAVTISDPFGENGRLKNIFGGSIDIENGLIAVGSVGADTAAEDSGSVYIFDMNAASSTQPVLTLNNPNPPPPPASIGLGVFDYFGFAVKISEHYVVASAVYSDLVATDSGTVYVYDLRSPEPNVPVRVLNHPEAAVNASFGLAIALDGSLLAVSGGGNVFVYDLESTSTLPIHTIIRPPELSFGFGLSLDEGSLVVRAHSSSQQSAYAFVFDLWSETPTQPSAVLTISSNLSSNQGIRTEIGTAIYRDLIVVGSPADNLQNFMQGTVHVFSNVNEAPTDIALSSTSIAENAGANAVVGTLTTTDVDAGDTFTYTLVAGTGDTDNGAFNISGSNLRATSSFDFETKSSYTIRIRSTDQGGLFTEKTFTISVTNVNEAPRDLVIPSANFPENSQGLRLGKLKVTDPDENDSHVFLLSDKRFEVINDELRLAAGAHFDFETESKVILRVTAIDQANASTSSSTTISIGDVNESPTAIAIDTDSVFFEELIGQRIGVLAVSDEDVGQTHSLVSLDERFEIVGNELRQKPLQSIPRDSGEITDVRVKVTDSGNPVLSAELTLQLRVIEVDSPWKNQANAFDVNADGLVTPIDALLVINYLNSQNNNSLNAIENPPFASGPFWDPSGDRFVSPIDTLLVINYLNTHPSGEGEYEPAYRSNREVNDQDQKSEGDTLDLESDPIALQGLTCYSDLMADFVKLRRRDHALLELTM